MRLFERLAGWSRRNMPTRETFARIRWLRPIAHRILLPELWRFHRRSVPRGVALGILVGVLVPVAQTVFAAIFALPARANVPVAAVTTFVTNPLTTPPIWAFAWWVGRRLLGVTAIAGHDLVAADPGHPRAIGWAEWLVHDVGPALMLGLLVVALVGAALGYLLSALLWRSWIAHKWAQRGRLRSLRGS